MVLLIFNLIPAFPLDGGRIARAVPGGSRGDRGKATRFSARLGQGFAELLIGYGIYALVERRRLGGLWTIVLGWMLGSAARAAIARSAFTEQLEGDHRRRHHGRRAGDDPRRLPAAQAYEDYFLRYQGWEWFAVVEDDGRSSALRTASRVHAVAEGGRQRAGPRARRRRRRRGPGPADAPLEALLGSEPLRRLGALMAVDAPGPAARRGHARAGHAGAAVPSRRQLTAGRIWGLGPRVGAPSPGYNVMHWA